jgi:ferredoxin
MLGWFAKRMASKLNSKVLRLEEELVEREDAIKFSSTSPERMLFNPNDPSTMRPPISLTMLPKMFRLMGSMMDNMNLTIKSLSENPSDPKRRVDEAFLASLEAYAFEIGIDDISYTKLSREYIFKNRAVVYGGGVIVLSMEMDFNKMEKAPSSTTQKMILETYNNLGILVNKMTAFLREHGYGAQAGHPLGGLSVYPPFGQTAGMGWHGLNGLLIGPKFGPRHRLAVIYTSIENLPIIEENEHAWIEDYCNTCKKCITACPPRAIYGKPVINENGSRTYIDTKKCLSEFMNNHGCSVCIRVCEFNRRDYYEIRTRFLNIKE